MMKNGDYSLKRIGGNSLGAVDNCWFPHLFAPKAAFSSLEILGKVSNLTAVSALNLPPLEHNPLGKVAVSKPWQVFR